MTENSDESSCADLQRCQELSKAAVENGADSAVNQQTAAADVVNDVAPPSSTTATDQPVYASVKKFDRSLQLQPTDDSGDCDAETEDGAVTYAAATRVVEDQSNDSRADHSTQDNSGYTRLIRVTSEGVATPIRFVVRLVGSVPMSTEDRDACSSCEFVERHVRRLCGRQHDAAETPSDVVYYWPTDVDITLELSGKYLRLVDSSNGSQLFSQRLHSVKQWSTGPGKNSRHFAYVSPEPAGERFACHVFRCCGDYCAKDITSTLRRVCGQMLQLKEQIATKM